MADYLIERLSLLNSNGNYYTLVIMDKARNRVAAYESQLWKYYVIGVGVELLF